MDGWTDGRMDGWTDGLLTNKHADTFIKIPDGQVRLEAAFTLLLKSTSSDPSGAATRVGIRIPVEEIDSIYDNTEYRQQTTTMLDTDTERTKK